MNLVELVEAQATHSPEQAAILTFTSGSTGAPKGAIRSHARLLAQYRALQSAIELERGEIELATMPIIALVNLAAGITTLIRDADLRRPGFVKTATIREQIQRFQPDRCVASPAFLQRFPPGTDFLKRSTPVVPPSFREASVRWRRHFRVRTSPSNRSSGEPSRSINATTPKSITPSCADKPTSASGSLRSGLSR